MNAKKRGLGRGLNTLISQTKQDVSVRDQQGEQNKDLMVLPVEFLRPGQYQPRKSMVPEALEELAASIAKHGIMQPVVVRQLQGESYEIIAGERRWRAAQQAGLDKVPVLIREVSDQDCLALSLIENIQREDLNAMEEALALYRLQQEFQLTQQQIADSVGRSRVAVANLLRLLNLDPQVQQMLQQGHLDAGHAKALLALSAEEQLRLAKDVVAKQLSVRQTEQLVKSAQKPKQQVAKPLDPDIKRLESLISERFGAQVVIKHDSKGKGVLSIRYGSLNELDAILDRVKVSAD